MKRIVWSAGIAVCAYVLWFAVFRVDWDFVSNDETTSYVSSVEMLNGGLHLALYEQRMWDAVLWTVIETKDRPALSWPAHNFRVYRARVTGSLRFDAKAQRYWKNEAKFARCILHRFSVPLGPCLRSVRMAAGVTQ